MICPVCKVKMIRRKSKFGSNYWWGCSNYPKCKVTSAEHPDGTLMSLPADQGTKDMRMEAHKAAEEIWGKWESPRCKKLEMYDWLEKNTVSKHIGLMEKSELLKLINDLKIVKQYASIK